MMSLIQELEGVCKGLGWVLVCRGGKDKNWLRWGTGRVEEDNGREREGRDGDLL